MKITLKSLLVFSWALVILINNCFFYFIFYNGFLSTYMTETDKALAFVVTLLITIFIFLLENGRANIIGKSEFIRKYIIVYYASIIIVLFGTLLQSNSGSMVTVLHIAIPYFLLIFYVPTFCLLEYDSKAVFRILTLGYIVWIILAISQFYLYNHGGRIFTNLYYTLDMEVLERNGRLRLLHGFCFGNFLPLYYLDRFLNAEKGKKKIRYGFLFGIGAFIIIYLEQTRAFTLGFVACIIVYLIMNNYSFGSKMRNVLLGILVVILFISSNFIDYVTYSMTHENAFATTMRSYAISYYLDVYKNNPLIGFGFTSNQSIIHGGTGYANIDDVGIFGHLARLGIFAIIIIVPVIIRMINIFFALKKGNQKQAGIVLMSACYIVMTSPTLIILDPQRILLLPVLVAVCEYLMYSYKVNGSCKQV